MGLTADYVSFEGRMRNNGTSVFVDVQSRIWPPWVSHPRSPLDKLLLAGGGARLPA